MSSYKKGENILYKIFEQKSRTKKIRCIFLTTICVIAIYALSTSVLYYKLGDLFFGRYQPLYNIRLAQFFYTRAAHPLVGRPAPYAFHQLSRTYFIQGDLIQAVHNAKEELIIYPEHTATYYIIGLTYGYLNNLPKATEAFSHYIETHPESWAGRNDLAWLQFRAGNINDAIVTIKPAYQVYPDNPWVANTYGVLLMNKKEYQEAYNILNHGNQAAQSLSEGGWGRAYPGNDPRVYGAGLQAMRKSLTENLINVMTQVPTTTPRVDNNKY